MALLNVFHQLEKSFGRIRGEKKELTIPESQDKSRYIRSEVKALFTLSEDFILQQYSKDWGEYVDVEDDDPIINKTKLQVVVAKESETSCEVS